MDCRRHCGACCIAPSITRPYYGMPAGKAAGERCVHLDASLRCALFGDPRRPQACADFQPEPAFCGSRRGEALRLLTEMEFATAPVPGRPV
ncbi:YkgJ family cysteine cluster protein [Haliea sp. E17]|uniref:YkgJ family cysteine cluster protein n=1 Tax=Haliea sp. E17 TaxID=3401576 RepID=UPI003AAA6E8E